MSGPEDDDFDLTAMFTTPQVHTDDEGRHTDSEGREYVAVEFDGELTYTPSAQPTDRAELSLRLRPDLDQNPSVGNATPVQATRAAQDDASAEAERYGRALDEIVAAVAAFEAEPVTTWDHVTVLLAAIEDAIGGIR